MSENKKRISYFSSEHVSPGHPDKVCDVIAESIVDEYVNNDLFCRVACDALLKDVKLFLGGEITSKHTVNYNAIVGEALRYIGYNPARTPKFNFVNIDVTTEFHEQSLDIAMGVDREQDLKDKAAGDQGMAYGGAVKESPELISHAQQIAKDISMLLWAGVKSNRIPWGKPDIKTQATIKYEDGVPKEITDVVVAISHDKEKPLEEIREEIRGLVATHIHRYAEVTGLKVADNINYYINATGSFTDYGPIGDSGEVGRKIIVDQTGGFFAVGGGTQNGKDATKVDRSGVYMCRYAAKNIVAAGLAEKCQIQAAYCIGVKEPISVQVDCFGTNKVPEQIIEEAVRKVFDFTPGGMILEFDLHLPAEERGWWYRELGAFGHIAPTSVKVPWEEVDKVPFLLEEVAKLM